jgi:hypothetical protein
VTHNFEDVGYCGLKLGSLFEVLRVLIYLATEPDESIFPHGMTACDKPSGDGCQNDNCQTDARKGIESFGGEKASDDGESRCGRDEDGKIKAQRTSASGRRRV